MRDAVKEIHRAIERINDPLMIARLVADDSLFAIKRVLRKTLEQDFRDRVLGQDIDLELDVMRGGGVDHERLFKMRAEQFTGRLRRFFRHPEIMHHNLNLTDSALPPRSFSRKKTGRRK